MRESRIRSEICTVMIDTMISVTTKMPPIEATSATVSLLMYCCANGRSSRVQVPGGRGRATQATMASTSRVKPRTAARRAEITTTPRTTRSRIEKGMGPSLTQMRMSRLCGFEARGCITLRKAFVTLWT